MKRMHDILCSKEQSATYNGFNKSLIMHLCRRFYDMHNCTPDTIKLSYQDMDTLCTAHVQTIHTLEIGKSYGLFLPIPGGVAELVILSEEEEKNLPYYNPQWSYAVLECSNIDRAFERIILNSENKDE